MATLRVIKYGNPVLRMKAASITTIDDSIRQLADEMIKIMKEQEGIGLAAPQVAESRSLFVIDLSLIENEGVPMAVINPEIISATGKSVLEEGCLCVPDIREEITRAETIRVKYQDIHGNSHEETIAGLKARVFQHEIDHLNGILFVDRLGSMKRKLLQKKLKQIANEELSRL